MESSTYAADPGRFASSVLPSSVERTRESGAWNLVVNGWGGWLAHCWVSEESDSSSLHDPVRTIRFRAGRSAAVLLPSRALHLVVGWSALVSLIPLMGDGT